MFAAGLRPTDTVYNPLPLYHSSAGILSCGPSFYIGLSVALRKKFSAKDYWKDCVKYNATVDIYLINTKTTFIKSDINTSSGLKYSDIFLLAITGVPVHWRDMSISAEYFRMSGGEQT